MLEEILQYNKEFVESKAYNFFAPPSIPGIGKSSGLSLELLATNAAFTPSDLYRVMGEFLGRLGCSPNRNG